MAKSLKYEPFTVAADDPLAAEHQAVKTWVEQAHAKLGRYDYFQDIDLKELPSGAALLTGNPEQSRRWVMAAVAQTAHWDRQVSRVQQQAVSTIEQANPHLLDGWDQIWGRRRKAETVVRTLMKRKLPFDAADLCAILTWCEGFQQLSTYNYPLPSIVRALERYAADHPIDDDLRAAMLRFAGLLRSALDKDANRLATALSQLCLGATPEPPPAATRPSPRPAPAGTPGVFTPLKRLLGMIPAESAAATAATGPDHFPLPEDSPLRAEHERLSALFTDILAGQLLSQVALQRYAAGREILALTPLARGRVVLAAAERHVHILQPHRPGQATEAEWQNRYIVGLAIVPLLSGDIEFDRNGAFDLLLYAAMLPGHFRESAAGLTAKLAAAVARMTAESPLSEGERFVLSLYRNSLISGPPLGKPSDDVAAITALIQDDGRLTLMPGEAWADAVNADTAGHSAWLALFRHALTATASRPTAKWSQTAKKLITAVGGDAVREAFARWFPQVSRGRTLPKLNEFEGDTRGSADTMHPENATCLRGLLWCVPLLPNRDELARQVTAVAVSAYKKVPGVGPRAVKVGNAAVFALAELGTQDAVGQLAMLKVRVRFGTAQKEIEKAFDAAAAALALPREQIEELGVPSYGLEEVGRLTEEFGRYRAEVRVTGSDAELTWHDAAGKPLKSVPAAVKADHNDEWKELQQSLKDIRSMLPAQRDRIDGLFLMQKSWPIAEWRDRYHDHPLVGTIARRLLWCVDGTPAVFADGQPTDVGGRPIRHGQTAEVTLWHPVGRAIDEVTGWRRRLEERGITQPFKQAYREVYLLTDAERNTRTYSNRFAAHVIRQHQFHALCGARGWKNKLRLMVDDMCPPPTKELPQWGLRAEFWVEGIGDDYGTDTNESGSFLRLATDQVRFYRAGTVGNLAHVGGGGYAPLFGGVAAEAVPLDEVPPLVLSEVMRDVDLFVGVASVGNDPTWQDGGPGGRHREYWEHYSFGELTATAATRKQVLERLVPRLKIAGRCTITERFLVVRGDKRTYKIHLGSGNILMEPNDQYLCIVPDAKARSRPDDLYLPFEGDAVLSIILSKALMLADDTKIKDPTITRQIDAK